MVEAELWKGQPCNPNWESETTSWRKWYLLPFKNIWEFGGAQLCTTLQDPGWVARLGEPFSKTLVPPALYAFWCQLVPSRCILQTSSDEEYLTDRNGGCRHRWHHSSVFSSTPWSPGLRGSGVQTHRTPLLLHFFSCFYVWESKMHWDYGINSCVIAVCCWYRSI